MNIFHKVTLESLKKNRTRTVVTIIGIMLSTALICAVTTSVSSFLNYALENIIYQCGSWHGAVEDTDEKTYAELSGMEEMEKVIYAQQIGYAEIGSQNEYKPYLYILGMGEGFADIMPVHLVEGEYPDSANEILLPEHLFQDGGVYYQLGDTLTLDIGERLLDGYHMGQNNPCYAYTQGGETELNDEILTVRETRTYTVVGFYERPEFEGYTAPGYTALTMEDTGNQNAYQYDVYFTMKNPRDTYPFLADHTEYFAETNDDVLMMQGSFQFDGMYGMLYGLATIFVVLIMFGSVSLIYNAFSISVSERTKQFGLLSSIGATRKQLRHMVLFEALTVGAAGIAAGILLGIAGISVTLLLIGHKFDTLFEFHIPMRVCVSPAAIGIACAVALLTVLISAWIPSKRATRVTAIEAIRQSADIKAEKKSVRTPRIIYKLFGLPGMLAQKHYKRSKKKYRATVVSLFMSVVLFISAASFTDYLTESVNDGLSTNGYDLLYASSQSNAEKMSLEDTLTLIAADENVDDVVYIQSLFISGSSISEQQLTAQGREVTDKAGISDDSSEALRAVDTAVYFVNDAAFRVLLAEYNLSEEQFMNPDAPLALAVDGNTIYNSDQNKYVKLNLLAGENNEFTFSTIRQYEGYYHNDVVKDAQGNIMYRYVSDENDEEYMDVPKSEVIISVSLKSGKTIYERPFFIMETGYIILIYPYSAMEHVLPDKMEDYYTYYPIQSENHAACYTSLEKTLKENQLNSNLFDYAAAAEQNRNIIIIIQVFSYGFIVLISLIAAANVFNTISTNINLRRREFAMLKSIGMTSKGFNKMMSYECILYGTKALLLGVPVSFGTTYLIYRAVGEGYNTDFRLPWKAVGIAVLSVFAVVFATMLYAMRKIKKDNPIDALKNENT